jgi:hypothetical protein
MMAHSFMAGFIRGFRLYGENINLLVNVLLLSLVYFTGVALTSISARILSKRFLDLRQKKGKTYWEDLNLKKKPIDEYYRQF